LSVAISLSLPTKPTGSRATDSRGILTNKANLAPFS
jgi:hypothetical protein